MPTWDEEEELAPVGGGFADASGGLKALGNMATGAAPPPPDDGSNMVRLQRLMEDAELASAQKADAKNQKGLELARLLEGARAKIVNGKADYSAYEGGDPNAKAKSLMEKMALARGRRSEDEGARRFASTLEAQRADRAERASDRDESRALSDRQFGLQLQDRKDARSDAAAARNEAAELARIAAEGKKGDQAFKDSTDIRKEFHASPVVKQTQEVASSLAKVKSAGKTAAGDMSLIFAYMKMLDPGSGVKEGEYANAQNAAGWPERIRNLYNKAKDGRFLDDNQRADFTAQAGGLWKAQLGQYTPIANEYKRIASQRGLAPEDVVVGLGFDSAADGGGAAPGGVASAAPPRPSRTVDGETRYWDGSKWVRE